jgi:hypothetical protein
MDKDVECAQMLCVVADELARTYGDAVGDFDDVLGAHGKAFGLASEFMSEWPWDEIDVHDLTIMMLDCAIAYAKVAGTKI